jgi:hypothetical protein
MEDFNSISHSNDEPTSQTGIDPVYKIMGYATAVVLNVLCMSYLIKKECTNLANSQRIEQLEKKKSCPERRKRAINKLIETETLTQRNYERHIIAIGGEENNECPICLEKFEEGQDLSRSQKRICYHTFHAECLEPWLMKHDDCPCCRTTFIDESTLLEDDGSATLRNRSDRSEGDLIV